MSRVLALALVTSVLSSGRAFAEANPETLAPPKLDLSTVDRAYRRAKARRNLGIGLAVPGVTLNVLGAVLLLYGITEPPATALLSQGNEIAWGAIVSLVGLAIGVPGVVFWAIDQDAMDVLTWRRRQLTVSFRPSFSPHAAVAGLALSF